MKNSSNLKIINIIIEGIIFVALFIFLIFFFEKYDLQLRFYPYISSPIMAFLILINIFLVYHILFDRKEMFAYSLILFYSGLLVAVLFLRPTYEEYQYIDLYYLNEWWQYLFHNKIVFINIIGNVLLYVPLGILLSYYMKSKWKFFIALFFIVFIECIQFLTKRGIFDWTDVLLNYLGIFFGLLVSPYKGEINGKQTQQTR